MYYTWYNLPGSSSVSVAVAEEMLNGDVHSSQLEQMTTYPPYDAYLVEHLRRVAPPPQRPSREVGAMVHPNLLEEEHLAQISGARLLYRSSRSRVCWYPLSTCVHIRKTVCGVPGTCYLVWSIWVGGRRRRPQPKRSGHPRWCAFLCTNDTNNTHPSD